MAVRIMHVVDSLGVGGLENGLANLVGRLDGPQFEHVICAVRGLGAMVDRFASDQVRVLCVGGAHHVLPIQVAPLAEKIREVKPHIVHSRNWGAVEAVLAGRWVQSCRLVHSEHGLELHNTQSEPWRRRWFRRLAFEMADRVLSVSYQLRDFHSQRTGFPARKIGVIHNGVDTVRFAPQAAARGRMRRELGISESEFCVGAVGRLDPVKDLRTLLSAVDAVAGSMGRWQLLIVGSGPDSDSLQAFTAARANLRERVRFLGSSSQIPELLNALDAYVLPSISEGISNSLLEAMATGLPVIASNTGGNPEVVVDGESGLLFPVGDFKGLAKQLSLLYERSELRHRLGQQAHQRVNALFSLDGMVRKYEDLYLGLVEPKAA